MPIARFGSQIVAGEKLDEQEVGFIRSGDAWSIPLHWTRKSLVTELVACVPSAGRSERAAALPEQVAIIPDPRDWLSRPQSVS
jgi:hypothetical protein